MFDAAHPEAIIAALSKRTDAAGHAARKAMLGFVRSKGAPAIATLARDKAPRLFGDIKKSMVEYDTPQGARIAFGGLLSGPYAAAVHEEKGRLQGHVGTGTRSGKYVYRGSGFAGMATSRGSGNPGEWNRPRRTPSAKGLLGYRNRVTAWAERITRNRPFYGGAQGDQLIEWSGSKWRFRRAGYAKRYASKNYPKSGQPHWLFGRSDSAYEEKRAWLLTGMARDGVNAAGKALG